MWGVGSNKEKTNRRTFEHLNSRRQKCRDGILTLYFIILLFEYSNVLRFAVSVCFFAVTAHGPRPTAYALLRRRFRIATPPKPSTTRLAGSGTWQ